MWSTGCTGPEFRKPYPRVLRESNPACTLADSAGPLKRVRTWKSPGTTTRLRRIGLPHCCLYPSMFPQDTGPANIPDNLEPGTAFQENPLPSYAEFSPRIQGMRITHTRHIYAMYGLVYAGTGRLPEDYFGITRPCLRANCVSSAAVCKSSFAIRFLRWVTTVLVATRSRLPI